MPPPVFLAAAEVAVVWFNASVAGSTGDGDEEVVMEDTEEDIEWALLSGSEQLRASAIDAQKTDLFGWDPCAIIPHGYCWWQKANFSMASSRCPREAGYRKLIMVEGSACGGKTNSSLILDQKGRL